MYQQKPTSVSHLKQLNTKKRLQHMGDNVKYAVRSEFESRSRQGVLDKIYRVKSSQVPSWLGSQKLG